jgi:hypothetical protein
MFKIVFQLLIVLAAFVCASCASMLRIDGPYEGKVLDVKTSQPIEGAVVHGTWFKLHATAGGAVGEYYDSYEVLTDKNGEFRIPGKGLLALSRIDVLHVLIFKAGYEQWRFSSWRGLKKGTWPNGELTWHGDKGTFKLKKLTLEERLKRNVEGPIDVPNKDEILFMREADKETIEIGRGREYLYDWHNTELPK